MTPLDVALCWIIAEIGLALFQYWFLVTKRPQGLARIGSIAAIVCFTVGAGVWTFLACEYGRAGYISH